MATRRTHRTYFSATKWDWLKDNVESVKEARRKGTLMAGTVDTWLVYVRSRRDGWRRTRRHMLTPPLRPPRAQQLTGSKDGGLHITDASNACRTLFYNLHKQDWCDELCEFFDMPRGALPRIVSNSEVYGHFKKGHLLEGIPIAGLIGDQQAALVGNKCLTKGDAKQTYGEWASRSLCAGPLRWLGHPLAGTSPSQDRVVLTPRLPVQVPDASCFSTRGPTSSSPRTASSPPCVFSHFKKLPPFEI